MNTRPWILPFLVAASFFVHRSAEANICGRSPEIQKLILKSPDNQGKSCQQIEDKDIPYKITSQYAFYYRELRFQDESVVFKPGDFEGFTSVKTLRLKTNRLSAGVFRGLENLKTLDISGSSLSELVPTIFDDLPSLERLLAQNSQIESLPENLFEKNEHLKIVLLDHNDIRKIPSTTFSRLPGLEDLFLENNQITEFSPGQFEELDQLKSIHLEGNPIHAIADGVFQNTPSLKNIFVENGQVQNASDFLNQKLVVSDYADHLFCKVNDTEYDNASARSIYLPKIRDEVLALVRDAQDADGSHPHSDEQLLGYFCSQSKEMRPSSKGVLSGYEQSSIFPLDLNMALRNAQKGKPIDPDDLKSIAEMKDAIDQFAPLPWDLTVYRGEKAYKKRPDFKVGETYSWAAFTSTSLDESVGVKFLTDAPNQPADESTNPLPDTHEVSGDPVLYSIQIPAGMKIAFYPALLITAQISDWFSSFEDTVSDIFFAEKEVLLAPGAKYRVNEIQNVTINKKSIIKMKVSILKD